MIKIQILTFNTWYFGTKILESEYSDKMASLQDTRSLSMNSALEKGIK